MPDKITTPLVEVFWVTDQAYTLQSTDMGQITLMVARLNDYCRINNIPLSKIKMRMQSRVKNDSNLIIWTELSLNNQPLSFSYNLN